MNDCPRHHHPLIHKEPEVRAHDPVSGTAATHSFNADMSVVLGMVPVTCFGPNGKVVINALIDEGSDTTFVNSKVLKLIGLTKGKEKILVVNGASGSTEIASRTVSLVISGTDGKRFKIEARSHPKVCEGLSVTSWERVKGHWSHMKNLNLSTNEDQVQMLIGLDNGHLIELLEFRHGSSGGPYAFRTLLGWVARGRVRKEPNVSCGSVFFTHSVEQEPSTSLQ